MDLEFDARYDAFREQVRAFLEKHRPPRNFTLEDGQDEERIAWLTLQIEHGYWARTIPKEYGGYGAAPDLLETVIMDEEFNKAGLARGMNAQGPSMLVPTLLTHGSEEQKKRWIGPTMRSEVIWCQGYSEPGAGSDLASLQTSATEDGDDFVINGQKIWTSTADKAEMCFILVRTEPGAKKHEGISYVLLPMDTPGIEVRPLRTMSGDIGENSFNQVFLTDVRVPRSHIVGKRGEGWKIANTTLRHERDMLGSAATSDSLYQALVTTLQEERVDGGRAIGDPLVRDKLMALQAKSIAMKCHAMRLLTARVKGEPPGIAGLVTKLNGCQLNHDLAGLAIDAAGEAGALYRSGKRVRDGGRWQFTYMFQLGLIIGGGTAQVQKNIIAERGLGMPREPKA
jgi:alkylation response protein AidB-like acyl-CoA dehydrogenase